MEFLLNNIWFVLFGVWGLPLGFYRSRFRKMVYKTDSWKINIKPVFGLELKALFGNTFPENAHYLKMRNFYRFYTFIYITLFVGYQFN